MSYYSDSKNVCFIAPIAVGPGIRRRTVLSLDSESPCGKKKRAIAVVVVGGSAQHNYTTMPGEVWNGAKRCAFPATCSAVMMAIGNSALSTRGIAVWTHKTVRDLRRAWFGNDFGK